MRKKTIFNKFRKFILGKIYEGVHVNFSAHWQLKLNRYIIVSTTYLLVITITDYTITRRHRHTSSNYLIPLSIICYLYLLSDTFIYYLIPLSIIWHLYLLSDTFIYYLTPLSIPLIRISETFGRLLCKKTIYKSGCLYDVCSQV